MIVVNKFYLSKSGIKNNETVKFVSKLDENDVTVYNMAVVYEQLKERFDNMNCFEKYGNYNAKKMPRFVLELDKLI